jgi:hypothetical protein
MSSVLHSYKITSFIQMASMIPHSSKEISNVRSKMERPRGASLTLIATVVRQP